MCPGSHIQKFLSQGENINSIFPIPKSILLASFKEYQLTKLNQNKLICTISMSNLFTQPKKCDVTQPKMAALHCISIIYFLYYIQTSVTFFDFPLNSDSACGKLNQHSRPT